MKSERVPELSILKKLVIRECGPEWIMGRHLDGYLYAYGYMGKQDEYRQLACADPRTAMLYLELAGEDESEALIPSVRAFEVGISILAYEIEKKTWDALDPRLIPDHAEHRARYLHKVAQGMVAGDKREGEPGISQALFDLVVETAHVLVHEGGASTGDVRDEVLGMTESATPREELKNMNSRALDVDEQYGFGMAQKLRQIRGVNIPKVFGHTALLPQKQLNGLIELARRVLADTQTKAAG